MLGVRIEKIAFLAKVYIILVHTYVTGGANNMMQNNFIFAPEINRFSKINYY